MTKKTPLVIGILLYPGVEVLDFAGPFEVFTTANRMNHSFHPFTVLTLAEDTVVEARGGLRVLPTHLLEDAPPLGVLLLPGGLVDQQVENEELLNWIRSASKHTRVIASICNGAFLLAAAGAAAGVALTTHWEDAELLQAKYPDINVCPQERWIDQGALVSSAGISAGIDMALHLVSRFTSRELAERTAHQMDFLWHKG